MSGDLFYLWLDLETEGLEPSSQILEVAWCLTDIDLRSLDDGHALICNPGLFLQPDVAVMHAKSGLLEDLALGSGVRPRDVEEEILGALRTHAKGGVVQLAGSGVHFDRRFLEINMPILDSELHYRLMDVSVVERFLTDVCGFDLELQPEQKAHRAADDVAEHLERARRMRDLIRDMETAYRMELIGDE